VSGRDVWPENSVRNCPIGRLDALTIFTNRLIAAGESEGVHGKLVADSAAQFERNFILSQGARKKGARESTALSKAGDG
jgi:hypothetical protein